MRHKTFRASEPCYTYHASCKRRGTVHVLFSCHTRFNCPSCSIDVRPSRNDALSILESLYVLSTSRSSCSSTLRPLSDWVRMREASLRLCNSVTCTDTKKDERGSPDKQISCMSLIWVRAPQLVSCNYCF